MSTSMSYGQAKTESDSYKKWPQVFGTYKGLKTNQPKARV
jgi:hypothetical protein